MERASLRKQCASSRAAGGTFAATNPDCSERCIKEGAPAAFISEQAKAVFTLKNFPSILDELGYHVEVQARVDESAKTIEILSVKQLGFDGAACARPKKKSAAK